MIRGFFVLEGGIHWWVTGLEPQAVIRDESSNLSPLQKMALTEWLKVDM
jgi:hypothetical protein